MNFSGFFQVSGDLGKCPKNVRFQGHCASVGQNGHAGAGDLGAVALTGKRGIILTSDKDT